MALSTPEMSDPVSKSELIKIIECPVCMEIPFPPIFQCVKGHSICKSCKPKLHKCPICKSSLSNVRNFMVEEIVRASKHFCPYKKDGCTIEKTGELMETHIKNCQYGPFVCPRNGLEMCNSTALKFPEASSHFFFHHMATVAPGPGQLISRTVLYSCFNLNGTLKNDLNWPPNQILFDGKHFLLEVYTLKDVLYWAVMCNGCEDEAKKYRVKIVCQPGQEKELQWTIPVDSISTGVGLRDPMKIENRFLPSLTMTNFRHLAEQVQQASLYRFFTQYEIMRRDQATALKLQPPMSDNIKTKKC